MKFDFNFEGWIQGLKVSHVKDENGNIINVNATDKEGNYKIPREELLEKLNSGELTISLENILETNNGYKCISISNVK